jgi:uncharacterized protein YkwD
LPAVRALAVIALVIVLGFTVAGPDRVRSNGGYAVTAGDALAPAAEGQPAAASFGEGWSEEERQALELVNRDRRIDGLAVLAADPVLAQLAHEYARDMVTRGFFSHENPEGLNPFDRMRKEGVVFRYAGENLAINGSIAAAEQAFMGSPPHRANILNRHFSQIGIGVCHDNTGAVYVVQEFSGN